MSINIAHLERQLLPLLIIIFGIILRFKLGSNEKFTIIKQIYQYALLPSTIFVSLTQLTMNSSALIWPGFGLLYNVTLFCTLRLICKVSLPRHLQDQTLNMTCLEACNIAPGLSSWAFIDLLQNPEIKGLLAFADFGNKIFAIFITRAICYGLVRKSLSGDGSITSKLKIVRKISSTFFSEPVSIACILGLIFSTFSLSCSQIHFFCPALDRVSKATLPVLLLYIGIKIQVPSIDQIFIMSLLIARSGIGLLFAAVASIITPFDDEQFLGLILVFQSCCGYMPLASMGSVAEELDDEDDVREEDIFHLGTPNELLTLSFPISIMILTVINFFGDWFIIIKNLVSVGLSFLVLGNAGIIIVSRLKDDFSWKKDEIDEMIVKPTKRTRTLLRTSTADTLPDIEYN
mmetsp:Transcript_10961/g.21696  ORF Transcript_10961/g.21696 Transcript_10961/m.21696 type:complete len:403 (-) Transcript_10961:10-1218(-)